MLMPGSRCSKCMAVGVGLGGHLKYSRRWSGVCARVLLGAQGAVCRGEVRRVVRTRGNKGEVRVTQDQCLFGENRRSILS